MILLIVATPCYSKVFLMEMIIAVDFDGTIVEDKYPLIGKEKPFAIDTLKLLQQERYRLILWTVRQGEQLDEAIKWCKDRGVEFYAVNKDYPEEEKENNASYSRKIKADIFIDDRNLGGLPDWGTIYRIIKEGKTLRTIIKETISSSIADTQPPKRKHWWQF